VSNDADSAGTDLGRRLTEQRSRAGLSIAEVAERAGMSPDYLAYLESSSFPNASQATLTRLAAALDTGPGSLAGAALNLPPGQLPAAKNPVLNSLTPGECRQLVAAGGVGRFLFVQSGRGPVAIPVNFRMNGGDVVFRTGNHSSIAQGLQVSFDVDHLDDALGEGWSVLLTGTASIIASQMNAAWADELEQDYAAGAAAHLGKIQVLVHGAKGGRRYATGRHQRPTWADHGKLAGARHPGPRPTRSRPARGHEDSRLAAGEFGRVLQHLVDLANDTGPVDEQSGGGECGRIADADLGAVRSGDNPIITKAAALSVCRI
jgi:transcriptional regulator with XRE-family HTH domain